MSKSDYSDSTGRVWNYRGSSYSIVTRINGADIEVIEYWGYAGIPYVVNYSTEYVDEGGTVDSLSSADKRNLDQALPKPSTETHYSGETVTINYPVPLTVSKAENEFLLIPKYDVDGEWVFQYYKNNTTGETYYPDEDETFRMPADSVVIKAYWKYYSYADVVYSNNKNLKELNKLLPDTSKDKVVPGETIEIQEPSKKKVTIGDTTYNYVGYKVNGGDLIDDTTSYTIEEDDIVNGKLPITWVWEENQIKVTYRFTPSSLPNKVKNLIGSRSDYPEVEYYVEDYKDVIIPWELDDDDQTITYQGETWYWGGWDKYYAYNEGKDIVFTGTWTREPTLYVSYAFASTKKSDGIKEVLAINHIPDTDIGLKRNEELTLPTVKDVDGWKFLGWTTNPNASKPTYVAAGETVKVTKNTQYTGVWEKQK